MIPASGVYAAPRVALFHGLEGDSSSHYAVALMHALVRARWNGVVVYFRGCSGEINRLPRAYHSGGAFPGNLDWLPLRLLAFFGSHLQPVR